MTKSNEILSLVSSHDSPSTGSAPPDDWIFRVIDLSKRFEIYLHDRNRVYEFFGNRSHHHDHWALRNLNFSISKGECFGIIGSNGAGKSTLLKMMSGITAPTQGSIQLRGDCSTLLDLGLGFHQSFSGRENIRLNCKLLGMNDPHIEEVLPKIIAFAELGDFIDYPIRTYSAGMHLRLGFSIAAHAPSDILLIDEVLTVGDQRFQRKCVKKIEEFLANKKTIILVSHDLHSIRSLCDRVLWLEKGRVHEIGPAKEIVDRYVNIDRSSTQTEKISGPTLGAIHRPPQLFPEKIDCTFNDPDLQEKILEHCRLPNARELFKPMETEAVDVVEGDRAIIQGTGEVQILRVQILDQEAHPRERFHTGDDLIVAVTFRTTEPVPRPIFGVALFRSDELYIHGPNTRFDGVLDRDFHGVYTFFIRWKEIPILTGQYRLSIAIFDQHHIKPHIWHNQMYDIDIIAPISDHGLISLEHDWGLITHFEDKEE